MTRGKVVLVPFPFDDFSTTKVRPALCLTEPVGPYRHVTTLIQRELGELSPQLQAEVSEKLRKLFSLT